MSSAKEADIVINGQKLNFAQAMTLRVAIGGFIMEMNADDALGDDEHGVFMAKAYGERAQEIQGFIFEGLT